MSMKFTENRKKIYDLIHKSKKPLSAEQIHEKLKPDLNLSTVYRGIEYLQSENLIRSVSFGSVIKYFFSKNSHKHFLYCQHFHEIIVFNDCAADQLQKTVKKNERILEEKDPTVVKKMIMNLERGIKREQDQKYNEGRQEGERNKAVEASKKMIQDGLSLERISKYLAISIHELEQIKKEIEKMDE